MRIPRGTTRTLWTAVAVLAVIVGIFWGIGRLMSNAYWCGEQGGDYVSSRSFDHPSMCIRDGQVIKEW